MGIFKTFSNSPVTQTLSHILPVHPSIAYDLYWKFAADRQRILLRRLAGDPPPWTEDPILLNYRFTNAYRASDRASQYLIRNVIYREDLPNTEREIFFRILLFKLFNRIETWELLEWSLGPLTLEDYSFEEYDQVLTDAMTSGVPIYSAAYVMPPGTKEFGHQKKHRNHLMLIRCMAADRLAEKLASTRRMQDGFELLLAYPTIGEFLAYQLIIDLNYSGIVDYTEMEFVVAGPGARSGIRKCFPSTGGLNTAEIIRFVTDRQNLEFERLGLEFQDLWGRSLQLVDCQNLFCEIDKYTRLSNPELQGTLHRNRVKRRFTPSLEPIRMWFPPKWGLNERIASAAHANGTLWSGGDSYGA